VPDGRAAANPIENILLEYLRDESDTGVALYRAVPKRADAGGLLPAMLLGVDPQAGQLRRVGAAKDAKQAAVLPNAVGIPSRDRQRLGVPDGSAVRPDSRHGERIGVGEADRKAQTYAAPSRLRRCGVGSSVRGRGSVAADGDYCFFFHQSSS